MHRDFFYCFYYSSSRVLDDNNNIINIIITLFFDALGDDVLTMYIFEYKSHEQQYTINNYKLLL